VLSPSHLLKCADAHAGVVAMTADAWITAGVLLVTLVALAASRYPPSAIVMAATVTLLVLGVIDTTQAFAGFSNPAPLTVAALYVVARAAQKTGMMTPLTGKLLGSLHDRARLVVPTASASAFLNNTPLVAMLIPDVIA
jgi:di/tricarboxylate transporter